MPRFDVFGIGNPLIDYLVETDDAHLASIGLPKGGMHLIDSSKSAKLKQSLAGKKIERAGGDSTANTLCAMAALGSKTVFLGKAGQDEDAEFYQSSLKSEGVLAIMPRSDTPTGTCVSLITRDAERTFAVHLGACLELKPQDLDTERLSQSKCLHLTGYQLEDPGLNATATKALEIAKANNLIISLDFADAGVVERSKPILQKVIENYATIVLCNESEAKAFTSLEDPKQAAVALGKQVKIAIVKVGANGSYVAHDNQVDHIPAFKVEAVDTTGAGDCYNAGFLHGLLDGKEVSQSALLGSFCASQVVAQIGARLSGKGKDSIRAKAAEIFNMESKGENKMDSGANYEVKSLALADQGMKNIEWAEKEMGALMKIKARFQKEQPLKGVRVGLALHVTKETAVLVRTLIAGGAQVAITGCNPLSTQDDIAAALAKEGVHVWAYKGENREDYYRYLNKIIEFKPTITIDDGCDLVTEIHLKHADLIPSIIGGCEETTTGIHRLHAMAKDKALKYPMIAVNDNKTKHLLDNYYGTGQSTFDGILRATNILIAGKTVVVAGYGSCGKGVAMRAKGFGAEVIVTEVDAFRALQARLDGFRVMPMMDAAKLGDLFVTVTGNTTILNKDHMEVMKDGAILSNSGHFDNEIDMKWLNENASKRQIRPWFDEYTLKSGKHVFVCGEGRLVNLACAEGHPSAVMSTSFCGQALAVEYCVKNKGKLSVGVHLLPAHIDDEISRLQLDAMGIQTDTLTAKQKEYMSSWQEGT